jgi:L-alanine-DL-glutamate epimerase-like enolase superfamily enzyme
LRISRIRLTHHGIALDPPFRAAWDNRPRTGFQTTVVRVETDEGVVGIGSGDAMPGFAGHESLFVGRDPLDLERHARVIENLSFHYGRCWPLDVALWDLAGKIRGEPCWRLLGGVEGRVRVYASSGTRRAPEQVADLARRVADAGFPALKLRFHHADWRRDVAGVEAARAAVGDALDLMVDCNQAWRMPADTQEPWSFDVVRAVTLELGRLGVRWVEEPLHRGDFDGLRRLRDVTGVPIAGGEMTREVHELRELVVRGCVDVLQPDAVLSGGLTELRRVAALAGACGVRFTPHTWGNGIGLLANAHLYAGVGGGPLLEYPFDPPEWTPERRDFALAEPVRVSEGGWLDLTERPGLGLALDDERLARTRVESALDAEH